MVVGVGWVEVVAVSTAESQFATAQSDPPALCAPTQRGHAAPVAASTAVSDAHHAAIAHHTKLAAVHLGIADAYRRGDDADIAECLDLLAATEGG